MERRNRKACALRLVGLGDLLFGRRGLVHMRGGGEQDVIHATPFCGIVENGLHSGRIDIGPGRHKSLELAGKHGSGLIGLELTGGNMVLAQNLLIDGRIELALIRQTKEPNFARRMGAYASLVSLMLMGGKGRSGHILRLKGSHFLIETDGDVVWDLDGEKGMRGDLRVDVLPGHMKLFVPRKKKI